MMNTILMKRNWLSVIKIWKIILRINKIEENQENAAVKNEEFEKTRKTIKLSFSTMSKCPKKVTRAGVNGSRACLEIRSLEIPLKTWPTLNTFLSNKVSQGKNFTRPSKLVGMPACSSEYLIELKTTGTTDASLLMTTTAAARKTFLRCLSRLRTTRCLTSKWRSLFLRLWRSRFLRWNFSLLRQISVHLVNVWRLWSLLLMMRWVGLTFYLVAPHSWILHLLANWKALTSNLRMSMKPKCFKKHVT